MRTELRVGDALLWVNSVKKGKAIHSRQRGQHGLLWLEVLGVLRGLEETPGCCSLQAHSR